MLPEKITLAYVQKTKVEYGWLRMIPSGSSTQVAEVKGDALTLVCSLGSPQTNNAAIAGMFSEAGVSS